MMGTEIPLDTISLQCSCIYLHCRASALHVIPEIINEDNVTHNTARSFISMFIIFLEPCCPSIYKMRFLDETSLKASIR